MLIPFFACVCDFSDLQKYDLDVLFETNIDYNAAFSMTTELVALEVVNRIFITLFEVDIILYSYTVLKKLFKINKKHLKIGLSMLRIHSEKNILSGMMTCVSVYTSVFKYFQPTEKINFNDNPIFKQWIFFLV